MSAPKQIRRVPNISYDEFRQQHLLPNQPLLVGPDLIQEWNCLKYWRLPGNSMDSKGSHEMDGECSLPDLPFMKEAYGDFVVPVDEDGCRSEKTLREVIDIWESGQGDAQEEKMYVKDWHLALQLEQKKIECMPFYLTPDIFVDDWMNRYYLAKTQDDFRFVYMGPAGTFTRLHRDVYTSYSWSTNIVGRKRWWLFPPHVTEFITNAQGETVADDVLLDEHHSENLLRDKKWPHWNVAREAMYVVEQEEGETIFVPSGWYHQVLNLTFCISINHNWSNAHNLQSMYQAMVQATKRVEHSIEDVKELLQKQHPQGWEEEWTTVVQDLLRQDAGWDWSTFWAMVLLNLEDAVRPKRDEPSPPFLTQARHIRYPMGMISNPTIRWTETPRR
ncbi:Clavaminate synthase-like protein [Serendipita vermifera]|nr:Clavaminate synthase-like protein [Serendipita vermifera]